MPTLANSPPSRSPPFHRRRKSWARKIERCCCTTFAYFPLAFVYGLTSWAVYVEVTVSFSGIYSSLASARALLGIALYALGNTSYTIAVFTSPGSPLDRTRDGGGNVGRRKVGGYEGVPAYEDEEELGEVQVSGVSPDWLTNSVTAKSTGQPRYCKKCQSVKPDRTHHCSACGKCVLKMDHHCPWLATCVGFKNYKPFLLFLIYISLFCWVCFAVAARWVWAELVEANTMDQGMLVVNAILLSVLGGIIGLVLSGFTAWHIYLASSGQTTIESLEKTRYLAPLRKSLEPQYGAGRHYLGQEDGSMPRSSSADENLPLSERLKEIHANALPGVLRPEEGETTLHLSRSTTPIPPNPSAAASSSRAQNSLHRSYASLEAQRERDRYDAYLNELDSEKMPNAFDMGRKRNLLHIFGAQPLYWFLPVCNTTGDGWVWEVSPKWLEARDRLRREREQRPQFHDSAGSNYGRAAPTRPPGWKWTPGTGFVDRHTAPAPALPPSAPPRGSSRTNGSGNLQMQSLDRRKEDDELDEATAAAGISVVEEDQWQSGGQARQGDTSNWNDIPEDFLTPGGGQGNRSRSRGRRKGD